MGTNQAIEHLDRAEGGIKNSALPEQLDRFKNDQSFDAGHIWMNLAGSSSGTERYAIKSGDKCKTSSCIPGLPDLDLHSSKDDDHGGKSSVAEQLIDDIESMLAHNKDGRVHVHSDRAVQLSKNTGKNDLPVIKCDEVPAGQIGILMSRNSDGHTYYTPFVAAQAEPHPRTGSPLPIKLNENAAKELHIDKDLKHGGKPKIDVIALPLDAITPPFPRSTSELNQVVVDKVHGIALQIRDTEARERANAEKDLPEPPPPDPEFGYRRTDRSPEQLRKIAEGFRDLARESQKAAEPAGIEDRMKTFGKQAQADIVKYQKEIDQHKPAGEASSASDSALMISKYNLSYAKSELAISKDKGAFTRHMQARASAAAALSFNPDMDGALSGHRVVINSGHYPGDKQFPGFFKDDTAEWKLNMESEDVVGAMIKMTGGAVELINQIDLKDRGMTGLANAIKAARPEAAIAIHHDDGDNPDDPALRGTLTLHCAKTAGAGSLDFAKAVHMAKVNYAGLDDRVNSKGDSIGIREQCGRGIQGHNIGAPFILDEQLSTHKDEWPSARAPKVNAEIQFAHVAGLYELLNNKPRYKESAAEAKLWKDEIWSKTGMDDIWTARPKVGAW